MRKNTGSSSLYYYFLAPRRLNMRALGTAPDAAQVRRTESVLSREDSNQAPGGVISI